MTTITIPKHFAGKDLVLVPKDDYEALEERASFAPARKFKTVKMTKVQRSAFEKAEQNFKKGKTLTLDEFRQKLGVKHRPRSLQRN